ncbi:MAG TPA: hypothetical protein VNW54_12025 [Granulicella sp.]|jgi:hypothetical protein|nr:hypothetical protein [Granulicella sp.]
MKITHTTALFALVAAAPALAQTTGVSNPPAAMIEATPDDQPTPAPQPKPSAAVAVRPHVQSQSQPQSQNEYQPYQPQGRPQPATPAYATSPAPVRDPDAEIVTTAPQPAEHENDDDGVVTYIPGGPNEVPPGTLLRTRIHETISTTSTAPGTLFSAEVIAPMERAGQVIIPTGSVVHGRVTVVRGGRRISGAAAIHLLPEYVSLPDGTQYTIHAQVIDTDESNATRVDEEGTILRRDHPASTLAAMSLTTGGAAAAGAVVGGGVGALVGAGIGAGVSTVWWLKQDRQETIPQDTGIVFSLLAPLTASPRSMGTR